MVVLKMIRNTYGGTEYLETLARYIKYDRQTGAVRPDFVCLWGQGVDGDDPDLAYHQMLLTRRYFGKMSGNPLVHYMVSFDLTVKDQERAISLAMSIAAYFKGRHQVLIGLHKKQRTNSLYHAHFMVNSVNYVNGEMIDTWKAKEIAFVRYIQEVTGHSVRYCMGGMSEDV